MTESKNAIETFKEFEEVVKLLWNSKSREEKYCAIDLMGQYKKKFVANDEMTLLFETLLTSATWWDTLDLLAAHFSEWMLMANRRSLLEQNYVKKWITGTKK